MCLSNLEPQNPLRNYAAMPLRYMLEADEGEIEFVNVGKRLSRSDIIECAVSGGTQLHVMYTRTHVWLR